jgi:hypothetical protein
MEYRQLGGSGFKVPALSFGTGTFGGCGELLKAWGASDAAEATLGAVGWNLTAAQVATLDAASAVTPAYPYWHQRGFAERNPPAV